LIEKKVATGGYQGPRGKPTSELLGEIQFVDASIGKMVSELKKQGLFDSTLIAITAKHGQSPIDPNRFFPIPGPNGNNGRSPATIIASLLPFSESPNNPNGIGPTEDDVSLLWLANSNDTADAVTMLQANATQAGIGVIFVGPTVAQMFNPPDQDPRTPDIVITPNPGVVYTGSGAKLSEHGGFSHDDTNVIMLLSNPSFSAKTLTTPVGTAQVAPTILRALDLDPELLDAVRIEGTPALPGLQFDSDHE